MRIGSDAHKELFCRRFHEAHRAYEPDDLPWPELDELSLDRLRAIPFWEEAIANENDAGVMFHHLREVVDDPVIREAVELQGFEEARHARLLHHLVERYGIEVPPRPPEPVPADVERAFVGFGYSECLDSFGAYGLFALARRAAFFPEALFEIFDRILDEEAQHTVFFVNWLAHHEATHGRGSWPWLALTAARGYGGAIWRLVEVARSGEDTQEGFTATGARTFLDDLTPAVFVSTCVEENARRMRPIDPELLQPRLLPRLARLGLPLLRLVPIRFGGKPSPQDSHRHSPNDSPRVEERAGH